MKLVTFTHNNLENVGVVAKSNKSVYTTAELGFPCKDMNDLIERMDDAAWQALAQKVLSREEEGIPLDDVVLEAPIPYPRQDVICLGLNYMDHNEEMAKYNALSQPEERKYPIYFAKHVDRSVRPDGCLPSHSGFISSLDYECELAVIIKRDCFKVPVEKASEVILGYTVLNDVTARELSCHKQNFFMKSLDGTNPMGPWIVTADEIGFPPKLALQTYVNGQLRQDSNTDLMIFGIDYLIANLTQGVTLKAGSIIATGTPKGTGVSFSPPVFLKPGDVVECVIEGVGHLKNTVK